MSSKPVNYGTADPEQRASLTGLELMRTMLAGDLPGPTIGRTLNFVLVEVEKGHAKFEGHPTDQILNPLGIVHGGWALTLIDSACGCAAHSTLPAGVGYTTLETKVNFTRAITPNTGKVFAEGHVVAQGRQVITAEAKVTDANGRLLAHGTSTLLVLRPEKQGS
ncbi:MAG: PaaI family thioesterase [Caulobacterales bacterium]